jgi:outer membrane protease
MKLFFLLITLLSGISRLFATDIYVAIGGRMEDYDFLIAGSNEVSHYSRHESYLDKDFTGTLALSYVIRLGVWNLEPGIGFSYSNRKWSAQDGYVQYPISGIWNGNEPKQSVSGTIISYEQALWFPFISLNVAYRLNCFEAYF